MSTKRFHPILGVCVLVCAGPLASCRERPSPASAGQAEEATAGSPLDAARKLHDLHEAREYGKIAELIAEEGRSSTIRLLIALDDVVSANGELRRTAETAYFGPQSEYWDLAAMEDNLGVFSKKVSFISVAFRGDRAVVSLQQGDNVPLVHVEFVLQQGRWLLVPEQTPGQLAAELNELARQIHVVEHDVAQGASLNAYVDAFFYRVVPQMRRVATAGRPELPEMTAWTPDAD